MAAEGTGPRRASYVRSLSLMKKSQGILFTNLRMFHASDKGFPQQVYSADFSQFFA
jgi:hypothetical protein